VCTVKETFVACMKHFFRARITVYKYLRWLFLRRVFAKDKFTLLSQSLPPSSIMIDPLSIAGLLAGVVTLPHSIIALIDRIVTARQYPQRYKEFIDGVEVQRLIILKWINEGYCRCLDEYVEYGVKIELRSMLKTLRDLDTVAERYAGKRLPSQFWVLTIFGF
jgi:hypothetical protein